MSEGEQSHYGGSSRYQRFRGEVIDHAAGDRSVKYWLAFSALWFPVFTTFGFVLAVKFFAPTFLGDTSWLTFGRVRPAHVNGVMFGFLSSGLIGGSLWITPRLCAAKLHRPRLSQVLPFLWNGAVLAGIAMIMLGGSQGREYAELPWVVDVAVMFTLLSLAYITIGTVLRRRESKLYVSLWYFVGTFLWFPVVYLVGNVMWNPPVGALNGIHDAIFNWYYGHNVLGLWFTTLGLGMWYYFVPKMIRKPLYSHLLSLIAFFSIAFFYTGVGGHHLLQSPIPEWLKTIAVLTSWLMLVPVLTFAVNIVLTMRGSWGELQGNRPLQFVMAGFVMYVLVSFQGSLQALRTTNAFLHFSQWTVGHAHLALLGGFGFLAVGVGFWMVPKVLGTEIYSRRWMKYAVWIATTGFVLFFLAMTVAGLVQNANWWQHVNVVESIEELRQFYVFRAAAGGIVIVAAYIYAGTIGMTFWDSWRNGGGDEEPEEPPAEGSPSPRVRVRGSGVPSLPVLLVGGLGVFLLMTFMVVAMPYMYTVNQPSDLAHELTPVEERGEQIYKENGCVYCHSQFTRPQDWARGEVSQRGDFFYSQPHFLGTERTGPNLAKIGGKRPTEWHMRHYENPRNVSPRSIMPPFDFLSDEEIRALEEYTNRLGTKDLDPKGFHPELPPEYRGRENPNHHLMNEVMSGFNATTGNFTGDPETAEEWEALFEEGKETYTKKCLPCHGASGNGEGPYARNVVTRPADLNERIKDYPSHSHHFWRVKEGVPGTAMPPWGRTLSDEEIWIVNTYETSFVDGALRTVSSEEAHDRSMMWTMENDFPEPGIAGTEEQYEEGEDLYELYCEQCHGPEGRGNGSASDSQRYGYVTPRPADLQHSMEDMGMHGMMLWMVREGVPTTNMPPWKHVMSDEEIDEVLFYAQRTFSPRDAYHEKWAPLYGTEFAETQPGEAPEHGGGEGH